MTTPQNHDNKNAGLKTRGRLKRIGLGVAVAATAALASISPASAIVNGDAAIIDDHPWQVSLQADGDHFCGGSIVGSRVILTAAHCVEGETASGITVLAGATNANGEGQRVPVSKIESRPEYATQEIGDAAILTLSKPLDFGPGVQPIALASRADIHAASTATVTGWGTQSENGDEDPGDLRAVAVPLVDDATCSSQIDGGIDAEAETCAGGTGTDSCYGDSGGPLVVRTPGGEARLAGVVSWGEECGGTSPGIYAEVPTYAKWIADAVAASDDTVPTAPDAPIADSHADDGFDGEDAEGEIDEFDYEAEDLDGGWVDAEWDDADFDDAHWDDAEWDDFAEGDFDTDFDDADWYSNDADADEDEFCELG